MSINLNKTMPPKNSSNFYAWQWALISSCSTLVVAIAFYGIGNLFSPKAFSGEYKNTFPFVNQTNKIRRVGARAYTIALNRAQQAYFTEFSRFGSNIDVLGVGIQDSTHYSYRTYVDSSRKTLANLDYPQIAIQIGQSKSPELKSYVGAVWLSQVAASDDITALAILCETNVPGTSPPPVPIIKNGMMECAPGSKDAGY
ncbi:hypothetical protein TUMEXPCC7403_14940 [Tumidithrix helvetica PCC 7403]|uniref:type IV pilin-like G/H family protein n=1 Tax=Tumidithrix helvetica TaxID=3457545 RepID=UPI003CA81912